MEAKLKNIIKIHFSQCHSQPIEFNDNYQIIIISLKLRFVLYQIQPFIDLEKTSVCTSKGRHTSVIPPCGFFVIVVYLPVTPRLQFDRFKTRLRSSPHLVLLTIGPSSRTSAQRYNSNGLMFCAFHTFAYSIFALIVSHFRCFVFLFKYISGKPNQQCECCACAVCIFELTQHVHIGRGTT